MKCTIELLRDTFAICRLAPEIARQDWVRGEFVSITRSREESSIVCRQDDVPGNVRAERDRRCLRIAGPLDLWLVGVIAQISELLARKSISMSVISTYDADSFLVRQQDLDRLSTNATLRRGHVARTMR